MRRLPRPAGRGRRPELRRARTSSTTSSSAAIPSERQERIDAARRQDQGTLGPEARRLGQPAPAGQSEPRRLQGGRRPLDIYWRIAKGITGAQMPAHYPTINHEQIWDLVNFVLALPYEPDLLEDGEPSSPPAEAAAAAASTDGRATCMVRGRRADV